MKEEKENLILKFLSYFVGPIQFVMGELCSTALSQHSRAGASAKLHKKTGRFLGLDGFCRGSSIPVPLQFDASPPRTGKKRCRELRASPRAALENNVSQIIHADSCRPTEAAAVLAAGLEDWVDFGVICGMFKPSTL